MESTDKMNSDGHVVITTSARGHLGKILLVIIFLLLMVFASRIIPGSVEHFEIRILGIGIKFGLPLFGLLPIITLGICIRALFDKIYIICDEYLLEVAGRCSFTQLTTRLLYIHIKVVDVRKPLLGRILNFGDVIVSTDVNQKQATVVLQGIYNPNHYKDLIQEKIHLALEDPQVRAKAAHAS